MSYLFFYLRFLCSFLKYPHNTWLVVWNIFYVSIQLGIVTPTDFHIFQRGRSTTNQIWFGLTHPPFFGSTGSPRSKKGGPSRPWPSGHWHLVARRSQQGYISMKQIGGTTRRELMNQQIPNQEIWGLSFCDSPIPRMLTDLRTDFETIKITDKYSYVTDQIEWFLWILWVSCSCDWWIQVEKCHFSSCQWGSRIFQIGPQRANMTADRLVVYRMCDV